MNNLDCYEVEKDNIRKNLNKYTEKAFKLLPKIKNPRILDVGCGTGVPTIKLAEISGGHITALDSDLKSLKMLQKKIKAQDLDKEVHVICDSIFTMDFPDENFDIIWAEGSVAVMGFENSEKEWKRFLKPEGFMVIHDDLGDINKKLELIKKYDYKLIAKFELPHELWWQEYYSPLEKLIKEFRNKYPYDTELIDELNKCQGEIDENFTAAKASSIVFIIQRI